MPPAESSAIGDRAGAADHQVGLGVAAAMSSMNATSSPSTPASR